MFEAGPKLKPLSEKSLKELRVALIMMTLIHGVGLLGLWIACPIPTGNSIATYHAQLLIWVFRGFAVFSLFFWWWRNLRELRKRKCVRRRCGLQ